MNKISLIIPIYNSEANLDKCLDSILNQTYKNIEILCINDGSKDNSETIIKNYCKKDKRFKLISKENTGVSDTRNYGIKESTGDYIMFIDADDYIDKNYLSKMNQYAIKQNADIVISAYTEVKNNQKKQVSIHKENKKNYFNITFPKEIKNYVSTFEYNPCWKQLIKKELLQKHNIMFDTNIKYGEDMLFSFQCYVNSKKTIYYKNFGYYYYINESSVMSRKDINSLNKHYSDNYNISQIIKSDYELTENAKIKLCYKTLKVYNKITWKMIYGAKNYKIWKSNVNQSRKMYKHYFDMFKIKNEKISKDSLFIILLKYKMYIVYYILQISLRRLTKKY